MKIRSSFVVLIFLFICMGCSTTRAPMSDEDRFNAMSRWDLPQPNPWFWTQ